MKNVNIFTLGLAAILVVCQLTMVRGQQDSDCGYLCLDVYKPVCAQVDNEVATAKIFSNECFLRLYNCQNKTNYVVVSSGGCHN